MSEAVTAETGNGILTLTINRPDKKNAINAAVWDGLLEGLRQATDSASIRAVVLTGAGGAFCSGADLAAGEQRWTTGLESMRYVSTVVATLFDLAKPTVAKVRGAAVGAGCNLALACDFVVASDDARFAQIFARRALSLDSGGSWLLPRLVGMRQAKRLAMLAETIDAREALELGLITSVVAEEELDAIVATLASRLAAGPATALALTKSLLNDSYSGSFVGALEREAVAQAVNFHSSDFREAVAAFLERREARFG